MSFDWDKLKNKELHKEYKNDDWKIVLSLIKIPVIFLLCIYFILPFILYWCLATLGFEIFMSFKTYIALLIVILIIRA